MSRRPCFSITAFLSCLLLLGCFSCVWLCATPWMAAHQAPSSLGFSRKEHWSGLPFPSTMHESEEWNWSHSVVSDSSRPRGLQYQAPPPIGFSRQEYLRGVSLPSPFIWFRACIFLCFYVKFAFEWLLPRMTPQYTCWVNAFMNRGKRSKKKGFKL